MNTRKKEKKHGTERSEATKTQTQRKSQLDPGVPSLAESVGRRPVGGNEGQGVGRATKEQRGWER